MKCHNCNAELKEDTKFCGVCGEKFNTKKYPDKFHCSDCNSEVNKTRWGYRTIYGIFLFIFGSIIPGIIYFINSNPYICPMCGKREFLSYKKGTETIKISSDSKKKFIRTSVIWGILLVLLILVKVGVAYNDQAYSAETIKSTIAELNSQHVISAEDDPYLESYNSYNKTIVYNFKTQGEAKKYTFKKEIVINELCTTEDTKNLMDHDVVYEMIYRDSDNLEAYRFTVDKSACINIK